MEIEDLEQELMREIWPSLRKFDKSRGNLEHFVRKILSRRSINLLKSFARQKRGAFVAKITREIEDENATDERLDLERLFEFLPNEYKTLCALLAERSVSETAQIIGKSRAFLYRKLERIAFFARANPRDRFLFFRGGEMKTLQLLETLSPKEIGALPVYDLMDLNDRVARLIEYAKELKEKLDCGLNLRFAKVASATERSGAVSFAEGAFLVVARLSQKVVWDREKIEKAVAALPREYQKLFEDARTIETGAPQFQISLKADK
jgi:DNA-directed RNA polymerase specialized sigma24 family protein